ncbi:CHAP domain-containing protein [Macrococcus equi]|uniref:CHAP domain-containing protein n=1 Tax=Macrococcus equi TaxID=3395462 RepID=UPI0039BE7A6D
MTSDLIRVGDKLKVMDHATKIAIKKKKVVNSKKKAVVKKSPPKHLYDPNKKIARLTRDEAVKYAWSQKGNRIEWDGRWGLQCYDWANAYWHALFNHQLYGMYAKNIHIDNKLTLQNESEIIIFDAKRKPQKGDMLIFYYGERYGVTGHVAVCLDAGENGMTIIEQNYDGSGTMPCTIRTCNFFGLIAIVRPNFK